MYKTVEVSAPDLLRVVERPVSEPGACGQAASWATAENRLLRAEPESIRRSAIRAGDEF
jgi:hypothetical protein